MPYCSIEEAWGNNFSNEVNLLENFDNNVEVKKKAIKKKKRKKKIKKYRISEFDNDLEYQKWKYRNNFIDDVKDEQKSKEPEYKYHQFSRNTNTLPGHNGPKNRVNEEDIMIEKDVIDSSYEEDDYNGNFNNDIYTESNEEDEQDEQDEEEHNNIEGTRYNISFVINKLDRVIEILKKNENGENNLTHAFLFILTGIFIIFVLDGVFRLGKNLSDN